jgi:phage host-nuclease inhibitor protein Gam
VVKGSIPKQCRLSVRRETTRTNKKDYRKANIDELETSSKIKNIIDFYMGVSEFKKGYQPGTNIERIRRVIFWLQIRTVFCWVEEPFLSVVQYTWG